MDYYFSVVKDVLPECTRGDPLPQRRQYIPKGSRPHICTTAQAGAATQLGGQPTRLRGDGTSARAEPAGEDSGHQQDDADRESAGMRGDSTVGLGTLLTVDMETGTRCVQYTPSPPSTASSSACTTLTTVSSPVPSGRRLVSLVPTTTATDATLQSLYASDDRGNIYRLRRSTSNASATTKHARTEAAGAASSHAGEASSVDDADEWLLIAPARSPLGSAIMEDSAEAAASSRFAHALGAPGWACVVPLYGGSRVVCAREHYQDLRVVDVERAEVVRTFATTHPATGLILPGQTSWEPETAPATAASVTTEVSEHVVLVAEGCLATLFDIRCPSAVLGISAARTAVPDEATEASTSTSSSSTGPLVPGRLTSANGQVRDVCNTVHPCEVAVAIDRTLCVYDYRKFTRAFSSSNVLKYTIASIAPFAGGRAVVCNGIDAEVRIIALHAKETLFTSPTAPLSLTSNQSAASRPTAKTAKNKEGKEDAAAAAGAEDPSGSTFRTRLNSSVSCTTTWQGGWVSAVDGRIAVGVSMDNELFLVQ